MDGSGIVIVVLRYCVITTNQIFEYHQVWLLGAWANFKEMLLQISIAC